MTGPAHVPGLADLHLARAHEALAALQNPAFAGAPSVARVVARRALRRPAPIVRGVAL